MTTTCCAWSKPSSSNRGAGSRFWVLLAVEAAAACEPSRRRRARRLKRSRGRAGAHLPRISFLIRAAPRPAEHLDERGSALERRSSRRTLVVTAFASSVLLGAGGRRGRSPSGRGRRAARTAPARAGTRPPRAAPACLLKPGHVLPTHRGGRFRLNRLGLMRHHPDRLQRRKTITPRRRSQPSSRSFWMRVPVEGKRSRSLPSAPTPRG